MPATGCPLRTLCSRLCALRVSAFVPRFVAPQTSDATVRPNHAWYNPFMGIITKDPDILGGTPVFRGTRVPIQTLFDYLEGGETLEEFLEGFPTVSREAAVSALEEAKQLLLARP